MQISQMKKMGGLSGLIDKLPSRWRPKGPGQADMDRAAEREVKRMEGIICSMTPLERRKPALSRPRASAASPPAPASRSQDVNRLLKQFEQMRNDEEDEGRRHDEDAQAHGRHEGPGAAGPR